MKNIYPNGFKMDYTTFLEFYQLQPELFDYKLKATTEIEKLNEIIKLNSINLNNVQNINECVSKIKGNTTLQINYTAIKFLKIRGVLTYKAVHNNV